MIYKLFNENMTTEFQGTELSILTGTNILVFDLSLAFEFSGWIAA